MGAKIMLKKVLSTVLSLSLVVGITCNSALASLPPNIIFFNNIMPTNQNNLRIFIQFQEAAQNFINNYRDTVGMPLDNLFRQFTRTHTLNYRDFAGNYHAVTFQNNTQVINLANNINNFISTAVDPLANYVQELIRAVNESGGLRVLDVRQAERLLNQLSQQTAALNHVQNQIANFSNQVTQIPQNRPTQQDFEDGRCIDTHLMG